MNTTASSQHALADTAVVIAAHDARRLPLLEKAIDSAVGQGADVEVIVAIDNNADLLDLVRQRRGDVRVVLNTGPRGASATRNTGARSASRAYLAFLPLRGRLGGPLRSVAITAGLLAARLGFAEALARRPHSSASPPCRCPQAPPRTVTPARSCPPSRDGAGHDRRAPGHSAPTRSRRNSLAAATCLGC